MNINTVTVVLMSIQEGRLMILLEKQPDGYSLPEKQADIDEDLDAAGCPAAAHMQLEVAVEEIFVNIASYAYPEGGGNALIGISANEHEAVIQFTDTGIPFNPLAKADPDVTLPAEQREIGGLGIFMVKKTMDEILYQRDGQKNILTITKRY